MQSESILIISFSDLKSDPRVNRQIRTLSRNYRVVSAGWAEPGIPGVQFIQLLNGSKTLPRKLASAGNLLIRRYSAHYWETVRVQNALRALSGMRFDLILANELDTLPLTLRLANGAPVLVDLHEYSPRQYEDQWKWRLLFQGLKTHLASSYLPKANAATTVAPGIAEEYHRLTGVRPEIILNAPDYEDLQPPIRSDGPIRLVHHGIGAPSRRLESMIEMMNHLDPRRFELHFFLAPGDRAYIQKLQHLALGRQSILFHDPVPMRELPRRLNEFDMGVFLLEPVSFNFRHALPNKFFEFIQARLAVAIGPSPEMAHFTERHKLGIITPDFDPRTMARTLERLTLNDIHEFKKNSHRHARELSALPSQEKLLELVEQHLGREK